MKTVVGQYKMTVSNNVTVFSKKKILKSQFLVICSDAIFRTAPCASAVAVSTLILSV